MNKRRLVNARAEIWTAWPSSLQSPWPCRMLREKNPYREIVICVLVIHINIQNTLDTHVCLLINMHINELLRSLLDQDLSLVVGNVESSMCESPCWTLRCLAHKQKEFISHSSGGWKSQIRVAAWSGSGENPLLGFRLTNSRRVLAWQKGQRALWVPFYKGANLTHEGPALRT